MSIETLLAENTAAMNALAAALAAQTAVSERVVAGQAAAMEKLEAAKSGTTRASTKTTKATEPEKKVEPAATESGAGAAANASDSTGPDLSKIVDADTLKAHIMGWVGKDQTFQDKPRGQLLYDMAAHFGCGAKFAELASTPERIKQAVFFVERAKLDLPVDVTAAYDFDQSPDQAEPGAAAASDDDFG
ncbi:hypothetical protein U1872_06155 [Sphingomonas sp. RB3P16]|uniref:hypothetical protein n=1 Tax=Parasphingomonas frigoris TaxID=3096163 RepID=UPI002FCCB405